MLDWLTDISPWAMATAIFFLRIVDVSLGTVRTIAIVQGQMALSVLLGFLEVLVWVVAVASVLQQVAESPVVMLAYALGFGAGNATGILLERQLALGSVVLRCITSSCDNELLDLFRSTAQRVTMFPGHEGGHSVTLYYVVCRRREVRQLIRAARAIDPDLFFSIDPVRESSIELSQPLPHATGWRGVLKMK